MEAVDAELLPLLQPLIAWSMNNAVLMLLVCARVAGLVTVGPMFGQGLIPGRLRIPLVLITSLFVVSSISSHSAGALNPLGLTDAQLLAWIVKLVPVLASEFLIGFAISLAVMICLSGLQLAGLLIDRQSGALIGGAYDPTLKSQTTATGRFLVVFGLTLFIVIEPVGGHEQMIRSLLDSFRSLPPGQAMVSMSTVELLSRLVHESLQLAVQLAAPAVAGATLLAMTTAWLGRSMKGGAATVTGYPVRALFNLLVLAASLTGVASAFVNQAGSVLSRLVFG